MKTTIRICISLLIVLTISIQAEDLVITGFSGGELSFKDVNAVGSYTIEWSSSLEQTNWSSNWSQLSQIPATGGEVRVRVPTFFRVRHNPAPLAPALELEPVAAVPQEAPVPPTPAAERQSAVPERAVPQPDHSLLNDSGFGGGSGTLTDPYRITSVDQLQKMESSLSGHYELHADIDLSCTAGWDNGKGFRPIGNSANPFSGVFNGNGHRITGLRIARFGIVTTDIALFGATSANAQIANVRVQDAVVAGCDFVGILVGKNAGTLTNCHVAGVVSGSGSFGGLIGCNSQGGLVERCSATIGVRPLWVGNHLGGLAGGNQGVIRDSFATGVVTGQENPGGLVGVNAGTIERCYASVDVESSFGGYHNSYPRGAGGLVAHSQGGAVIRDCFAVGKVKGPETLPKGSLVGLLLNKDRVYNSFTVPSGINSLDTIGKIFGDDVTVDCKSVTTITTALFMAEEAPLKSWDFKNIWTWGRGDQTEIYPQLRQE